MKLFLLFLVLSGSTFAESIRYHTDEIKGVFFSSSLIIEQAQAQMGCILMNKDGNIIDTRVSPFTKVVKSSEAIFNVSVKAGKYFEMLPGYKVQTCFYKFIILGKTKLGKAFIRDVVVFGSDETTISEDEIEIFRNKVLITETIKSLLKPLVVE